MGFVRKVVDKVGDVIENVLDDPLQAIVTVGAMAMGVPPVWAGALGGAANAIDDGTNILEGAALGGITGYVGGAAGGAAANAGAGQILAGAAGGAAAGATGAALTGNDIVSGAFTGGIMGGGAGAVASYFNPQSGNSTYTYDDGSTITKAPDGSVVGSTPATDGTLAPVIDLSPGGGGGGDTGGGNTTPVVDTGDVAGPVRPPVDIKSTGYSDSEAGVVYNGPNGPEVVLDSGKTVLLSDYEAAIQSGSPISVDGNMVTDFRVESSGLPRSIENPGTGTLPDGTELASINESNGAKWDDTLDTYVNPESGAFFSTEANAWVRPVGAVAPTGDSSGPPSSYVAPVTVNPDGSTTTVNWNGSITTTYTDGTSVISNPDGTSITRDSTGNTTINNGGGGTGGTGGGGTGGTGGGTGGTGGTGTGGTGQGTNGDYTYTYDDGSTITIHTDGTATSTPATNGSVGGTGGTTTTPGGTTTTPDTTTTTPGGTTTTPGTTTPTGWTPTPVTPIFPIVVPPKTVVDPGPGTTTVTPADFTKLQIPTGLNPGWMAPTPFYQTTSPVQSQFYWGPHSYQEGPTFNAQQYNTVPTAPKTPWGLQEMAPVARPQDIVDYINSPEYQAQFVSGPVVPTRG